MSIGKRSYKDSPYFRDMRYGTREHLKDLKWQRGVLSKEVDTMLIGDRESKIVAALSQPSQENMPDEKLLPEDSMLSVDEIEF